MRTLEMLWFRLIPLTSWMATAAVVVQTLIWIVRPTSPQTHRIAWACVLVSGIVFARIPINIPDHRLNPIAARQLKAIIETIPDSVPWSRDPHSDPRASVPGLSSARLSPDAGDRVRASQLGVRIESEVSVSPPAILLARLPLTGRQFALLAWGLGTAVLLGMGSLSYLRFARRARRFEPASGEWAREWHDLCCERRCGRPIPIVISESYGPALCLVSAGYCLVVPETLWMSLSPAERTAILRHELAHYERNDLFKSLFARLVVALHWFNPAAWWARRQFEAAGEWACDDQAARRCGSVAFARTLMQLAGIRFPSIPLTDSIGAGALYAHIRRLLIASSIVDVRWKRIFIAAVSVGVVALASVRINRVAEATSPPTIPVIASNETESPAPSQASTRPSSTSTPNTGLSPVDQFGDPLPRGAVMRLGTMRLRHYGVEQTAFSPDGEIIVSMAWTGSFCLWERKTGRLIRTLQDSVGDYRLGQKFALSPDGRKLVSVARFFRNKVANGYVCLWDLTTGKKLWSATVAGREGFESVAFSPDGTLVAAGRGPFTFFDVATGKELRRCGDAKTQSPKFSLEGRRSGSGPIVFSPDCRTLITLERPEGMTPVRGRGGHIRLWDVQTGNRSGSIPSDDFEIVSLFTSLDGNQIIAGGFRNIPAAQFPGPIVTLNALVPEIRYWDLKTGQLVRTFHLDETATGNGAISLSKDQTKIAWNVDGAVWIWDAVAGKPLRRFPGQFGPVSISCSPDGAAFAVGCAHVIEILETATGRRLPTDLGAFVNSLNAVKFSPDGRTIYTGAGDNGDLTAWDATTGAIRFQKAHGPLPSISSLDVSADGQWIATCGMKERLSNGVNLHVATLWDAHTGEPVRDFYDHDRPLWTQRVAISPDSRLLAVAGKRLGNEVVTEIWDVKSGKRIAEVRPAEEELWPHCMRSSSDSKSLFTLNATSYARRWNAITGALEKEFFAAATPSNPESVHWINGAAIAPDYRTIVSSEKRSLHTWNLGSGDHVSVIEMPEPGKQRSFNELAISGDGRLLAAVEIVSSPDANGGVHHIGSVIRIYDRTTGRELQNLDTGSLQAIGLDFSSYGNRLASVMSDGTALVWDVSPALRRLHQ